MERTPWLRPGAAVTATMVVLLVGHCVTAWWMPAQAAAVGAAGSNPAYRGGRSGGQLGRTVR